MKNASDGTVRYPSAGIFPFAFSHCIQTLRTYSFVRGFNVTQVIGEAQGSSSNLDKFVQHLKMGPRAAKVSGVEVEDVQMKEEERAFEQ